MIMIIHLNEFITLTAAIFYSGLLVKESAKAALWLIVKKWINMLLIYKRFCHSLPSERCEQLFFLSHVTQFAANGVKSTQIQLNFILWSKRDNNIGVCVKNVFW